MLRLMLNLAALSLVLAALAGSAPAAPAPDVSAVSAAGADFGFRLLHTLAAGKPGSNVFFSTFSVSQALTLTMNGAGGQTHVDMAKTLGLTTLSQAQINTANAQLLPLLTSDPEVQISAANALWANTGQGFSLAFEAEAKRFYDARTATLDFHSPRAAATINGWVRKNTQGKITKIVTADNLASATSVLTDALYFHGK